MKKLIALLLTICMLMTCVCVAFAEEAESEPIKCGIELSYLGASIFIEALNSIEQVAEEMNVDLVTWSSEGSTATCIEGIENFISAGCDVAFIQNWPGENVIGDVCQRAADAGMIILAYDQQLSSATYCLMADLQQLGYALADAAAIWFEQFDNKGTIVTITSNGEFIQLRHDYCVERLQEILPDVEIVTLDVTATGGSSGNSAGLTLGEQILSSYPDALCVIAADSSNTGLGVSEAFAAAGITSGKAVITMDGSLEEFRAILDDSCFWATIDLNLVTLMTELFVRGIEYARTGEINEAERVVYFDNRIVTPDTIDQYYDAETDTRIL